MSFELPEESQREEKKPKIKSAWKSVLAAGALAIASGVTFNETKEDREQERRDQGISATLSSSHKENPEKEKEAKEKYDYLLHNYHVRSSGKGTGYLIWKEYDLYVSNMNDNSPMIYMEQKARALEIAINSEIVDPEITGWSYLLDKIEFEDLASPPTKIHFGNTFVPFNRDSYSLDELSCLEDFQP